MSDEWYTPKELMQFFEGWDDPATPNRTDGLTRKWTDPTYVNPPYSNPLPWVEKAIEASRGGCRIAMLLKHDSSTKWWRLLHENGAYFFPLIGRLGFSENRQKANFPSVLVFLPRRHP